MQKMSLLHHAADLDLFVAVARAGSFSAVARQGQVAPSSVVRRINGLEAAVGHPLFLRSTRGLVLTGAGETLLARAVAILADLADAHAEIAAQAERPEGVLRISCLPTFGRRHLLPWLPAFLDAYPGLSVELDITERLTVPAQRRLDAAIRVGEPADGALYATRIAAQRWLAVASPAYLNARGRPRDADDLAGHRLLDKVVGGWDRVVDGRAGVVLRCDDFEVLAQAAVAGMGLAFLPDWVVAEDLAAGRLTVVFADPLGRCDGIFVLRTLARPPAKLRLFIDRLRLELARRLSAAVLERDGSAAYSGAAGGDPGAAASPVAVRPAFNARAATSQTE
jgi:DNA-binding transcriptional LysR family regulator